MRLLLDWMIFIHSSDLTGAAARELNQSVLSKMNVALVMSCHLARIVSALLDGILAQQIVSETNLLYVFLNFEALIMVHMSLYIILFMKSLTVCKKYQKTEASSEGSVIFS